MNDHDDEPTTETPTLTDAQLLAAIHAERRLRDDMLRAVSAMNEPERSDDDAEAE